MALFKIAILGAGRLASHLAPAFHQCEVEIACIYNRSISSGRQLAKLVGATSTSKIHRIPKDCDAYFIMVADNAIEVLTKSLSEHLNQQAFIIHCSGATPRSVLDQYFERTGIFYPLRSFNKINLAKVEIDHYQPFPPETPILLDVSQSKDLPLLQSLAFPLSELVKEVSDHQRAELHVAAVFANNFTNALYQVAFKILQKNKLPFSLLIPLIRQTAMRLNSEAPQKLQTGPAVRGDDITIKNHLALLEEYPEIYPDIYNKLTELILIQKDE